MVIADEVFLSVDAIKTHLRTLFGKFALNDLGQNQKRARLAECVFQLGLIASGSGILSRASPSRHRLIHHRTKILTAGETYVAAR